MKSLKNHLNESLNESVTKIFLGSEVQEMETIDISHDNVKKLEKKYRVNLGPGAYDSKRKYKLGKTKSGEIVLAQQWNAFVSKSREDNWDVIHIFDNSSDLKKYVL